MYAVTKRTPLQFLSDTERTLWAEVYATEYKRLCTLATESGDEKRYGRTDTTWQYGSALAGNEAERMAAQRADGCVEKFRERG